MTLAERVEQLVTQHGGLRAAARAIQVDPAWLCRMRSNPSTSPHKATLRRMGIKAVVTYELVNP